MIIRRFKGCAQYVLESRFWGYLYWEISHVKVHFTDQMRAFDDTKWNYSVLQPTLAFVFQLSRDGNKNHLLTRLCLTSIDGVYHAC